MLLNSLTGIVTDDYQRPSLNGVVARKSDFGSLHWWSWHWIVCTSILWFPNSATPSLLKKIEVSLSLHPVTPCLFPKTPQELVSPGGQLKGRRQGMHFTPYLPLPISSSFGLYVTNKGGFLVILHSLELLIIISAFVSLSHVGNN